MSQNRFGRSLVISDALLSRGKSSVSIRRTVYMILKRLTLIAAILALSVAPAQAALILSFNTEAAYNAAVGSQLFFIDFNGLPGGQSNGIFAGQVDFGSPEASTPSTVFFASNAMTDAGSTIANNGVGPIDGIFASSVHAFGLVFSSSGEPQTIELYDGSNNFLGSAVSNPGGFFGVLSDVSISSFVIRNGEFSPGNRDRYFVDDFRANAPVPEPGTLFLVGCGIVGLGAAYRRRKK